MPLSGLLITCVFVLRHRQPERINEGCGGRKASALHTEVLGKVTGCKVAHFGPHGLSAHLGPAACTTIFGEGHVYATLDNDANDEVESNDSFPLEESTIAAHM